MQFSKLFGVALLAMASSAQAQDPCTGKYAGYMPRTDQNAYWTTDTLQATFEGIMSSESCLDVNSAKNAWNNPSTEAAYLKSIPTQPVPVSKEWTEYIKYYGSDKFHIDWVNAAFSCDTSAGFMRDSVQHPFDPNFNDAYCGGDGDFTNLNSLDPIIYEVGVANAAGTEVVAGKECVGIEESVKKATSYVYQFIEMVQLMERAILNVRQGSGCLWQEDTNNIGPGSRCEVAVEFWDAAAAIFTGSLEGEEGGLLGGALGFGAATRDYGKTLYTLGEKRCRNFKTCDPRNGGTGEEPGIPTRYITASINSKILQYFAAGSHATYSGDKGRMEYFKRKISAKIMVPWTQGVFRYAHRLSSSTTDPTSREHKEIAELSTFALGALPKLWACSKNAAEAVEPFFKTGRAFGIGNEIDYVAIKAAFECNYKCLGITCKEVGSLFDGDANFRPDAEACDDKKNLSGEVEVSKCTRPNRQFNQRCRPFLGESGISGRTNREYFVKGLD